MAKLVSSEGLWTLNLAKQGAAVGEGIAPPLEVTTSRTLAAWGFQRAQLLRQSLGADTLDADRPIAAFDAADEIDFGQLVTLKDHRGITRFVGRRVLVPASAAGEEELKRYTFAGPWYWMERLVFHQLWQQLLINGALVPRQTSHVLLNLGVSVGTTIQIVAQYAIDQGAPFQLGTIDIPIIPIATESTDQTCAQIIIDQLRWAPDAVAWFDYATNPPKFHCRQADNLNAVLLNLGAAQIPMIADQGLEIAARPDLQIPAVALRYERTDTLNGTEYLSIGEDLYPPTATGRELNALSQTVTLIGAQRTTVQAEILCETIDTASLNWWRRVLPELNDPRLVQSTLSVSASSVQRVLQGSRTTTNLNGTPSTGHPRMLVEGQLVDWMVVATGGELQWEQEEISAEFTFDLAVDTGNSTLLTKRQKYRIAALIVATNAPSGTSSYETTTSAEEGESAPVGLAQYLYEALSGLEYQGAVNTTSEECTGFIGPGDVLNIGATAVPEHASMRARVQSVLEQIDSGTTQITFGPTPALSVGAILELLRASRTRRRWTASTTQTDGETASAATVSLGKATANNNTAPGSAQLTLFACHDSGKHVQLDATNLAISITPASGPASIYARISDLTGAQKAAQFRETLICEMVSGVPTQRRCWILRTAGEPLP